MAGWQGHCLFGFLPPESRPVGSHLGGAMRVNGLVAGGLAALLGACQPVGGVEGAKPASAVAAADWSLTVTRTLRIRQDEYAPLVITLRRDRPYVLKIVNGDDVAHAFSAPDFFQAIAVKSVGPADQVVEPGSSIDLPAGQTRELAFVPLRDGYYSFADGWTGRLLGGILGTRGLIVVEAIRQP